MDDNGFVEVNAFGQDNMMGDWAVSSTTAGFTAHAKIPGDVNGDLKVDTFDVALVAFAYGSRAGDARWNPALDLRGDGVIDILDVALVAFYYGTHA